MQQSEPPPRWLQLVAKVTPTSLGIWIREHRERPEAFFRDIRSSPSRTSLMTPIVSDHDLWSYSLHSRLDSLELQYLICPSLEELALAHPTMVASIGQGRHEYAPDDWTLRLQNLQRLKSLPWCAEKLEELSQAVTKLGSLSLARRAANLLQDCPSLTSLDLEPIEPTRLESLLSGPRTKLKELSIRPEIPLPMAIKLLTYHQKLRKFSVPIWRDPEGEDDPYDLDTDEVDLAWSPFVRPWPELVMLCFIGFPRPVIDQILEVNPQITDPRGTVGRWPAPGTCTMNKNHKALKVRQRQLDSLLRSLARLRSCSPPWECPFASLPLDLIVHVFRQMPYGEYQREPEEIEKTLRYFVSRS